MEPGLITRMRRTAGKLRRRLRTQLRPLVLTANGRSGTTLLMRLLARHPQISVYDHYPYERTQAAYFVNMYRVLTEYPADHSEHRNFRRNVAEHRDRLGRNPFLSRRNEAAIWYEKVYPDRLRWFTRQLCSDYYWHIALAGNKKHPVLFAEYILPGMNLTDTFYEIWPATKEILLVRDMRDIFCSIRSFNERRGYPSFGREYYESDRQYIDTVLQKAADDMVDRYSVYGDRLMLLRYEDLVTDTADALGRIFSYLKFDTTKSIIADMMAACSIDTSHMTSSGPAGSVGKWRSELEPELATVCNTLFRKYNETFGYDADAS